MSVDAAAWWRSSSPLEHEDEVSNLKLLFEIVSCDNSFVVTSRGRNMAN